MLCENILKVGICFLGDMIDIELFKKILSEDEGYIEYGDTISLELFELMGKYPKDTVKRLFKKVSNIDYGNTTFLL